MRDGSSESPSDSTKQEGMPKDIECSPPSKEPAALILMAPASEDGDWSGGDSMG